jgi:hypothetical protein
MDSPPDAPEPVRWGLRPVRLRDKLLGVAIGAVLAFVAVASIWLIQGPAAFTPEGPR